MSTGLGCPHAETDPDFLGLMVAFQARSGRRIDFVTINDPTSPTDTPEEFIALLQATADAAGASGLLANQARLLLSLARHAGIRAAPIATHVTGQTRRTVRSSSAYQQVPGPASCARATRSASSPSCRSTRRCRRPRTRTETVHRRLADTNGRRDRWHSSCTGSRSSTSGRRRSTISRPRGGTSTRCALARSCSRRRDRDQRIEAHRASCLGARRQSGQLAGNHRRASGGASVDRFTAARALAYRLSQQHRQALPEDSYRSFFEKGEISDALAATLIARYKEKQAAGQWVPDLGQL